MPMHRVLLVAAAWLAAAATAQHHYGPVPTDRCDAAMAAACGDLQGGEATCHACAGTHAATIRSAGCAPSDIDGFCTRGIDPRYKRNITVYHINPSTFGDVPVNENTGDLHGDMYFYLRSTLTPMECRTPSPSTAKDCANAEVVATDLIVRELVLEVDDRFTNYALCNVCVNGSDHHGNNHCKDGSYTCTCRGCNASIGARPCNRYGHSACRSSEPNWSCWRQKTAEKTVDGIWYSTLDTGLCNASAPFCTWRVAETVKRVSHACLNDRINTAVEAANRPCFAACEPTRSISSDCWITCFYDSVLGPEVTKGGPLGGMPLASLDAAWTSAFRTEDPRSGGCPAIAGPPPHPPPLPQQHQVALKADDGPAVSSSGGLQQQQEQQQQRRAARIASCSVMDHGAKGDGATVDTDAIAKAIEACDHVVFPDGKQFLTGTIELRSGLTLEVIGDILGATGARKEKLLPFEYRRFSFSDKICTFNCRDRLRTNVLYGTIQARGGGVSRRAH